MAKYVRNCNTFNELDTTVQHLVVKSIRNAVGFVNDTMDEEDQELITIDYMIEQSAIMMCDLLAMDDRGLTAISTTLKTAIREIVRSQLKLQLTSELEQYGN